MAQYLTTHLDVPDLQKRCLNLSYYWGSLRMRPRKI